MRTWLGRLGTFLLFLLVGLCFAPSLIPPFLDRHYYEGPRSDHYDGARFFNPDPGPRAGAHGGPSHYANRWLRGGGDRARWPDHVPVHRPCRRGGSRAERCSSPGSATPPCWSRRGASTS
jgi:hypothetical protein